MIRMKSASGEGRKGHQAINLHKGELLPDNLLLLSFRHDLGECCGEVLHRNKG